MDDAVDRFGGACIVRAIQVHRPVYGSDRLATDRANLTGHVIGHSICRTLFLLDHGNLRDDVTGLVQNNGVTDTDVKIFDEIRVVQSSTFNTGSGQLYRVEFRHRSDAAGTTRLQHDTAKNRSLFLSGILESNSPLRSFGPLAHLLADVDFVYLDDSAINGIINIIPVFTDIADSGEDTVGIIAMRVVGGLEIANIAQIAKLVAVRVSKLRGILPVIDTLHIENEHFQVPLLCDSRVRLTQRTGSAVAGIGEELLSCFCLFCIDRLKILFGHVALTAQLNLVDAFRELNAVRQATECDDIRCHVFSNMTVAASGRLYEPQFSVRTDRLSVHQRQAQAVNFALNREGGIRIFLLHRSREIAHFIV